MIDDNEVILLKKKVDAYYILGDIVHVSYKSGNWQRGKVIEVNSEFFIIDEILDGKMPIFFEEIKSIEKYKQKKEGDNDNQSS